MSLTSKRVLVVEDDFLIAKDLTDAVTQAKGEAVVVASAALAVDKIERESIDCALLNVNLDGEPSVLAASHLKAHNVPFVVVTGYSKETLPPDFLDAPYLSKPITRPELIDTILRMTSVASESRTDRVPTGRHFG